MQLDVKKYKNYFCQKKGGQIANNYFANLKNNPGNPCNPVILSKKKKKVIKNGF